jgi:hypothetical protein
MINVQNQLNYGLRFMVSKSVLGARVRKSVLGARLDGINR